MINEDKMFFSSVDENHCYPLCVHLDNAIDSMEETITLIEAIPAGKNTGMHWCKEFGEVVEHFDCTKAACSSYTSKSGRGVCKNRGKLYEHGAEININVKDYR